MSAITHANDAAAFDAEGVRSPVVDFWSVWSRRGRARVPKLEDLADAHGDSLRVVRVDVDAKGSVAQPYGIQSIPTIALIRNGEPVAATVGAKPGPQIEAHLGLASS